MDAKNLPQIDIKEAKNLLRSRAEALHKTGSAKGPRQLIFWGHRGVGKSELCEQVAQEMNIDFLATNLSTLEAPDFQGLPEIKNGMTQYARPNIFPRGEAGIWLLDEPNRAPLEIRQVLMQLLTTREINGHKLGNKWLIVCAANLSDETQQYSVDDLDPAFEDRFAHYKLVPRTDTVVNYLKTKHGSDHLGVRWLMSDNSIVDISGGKGSSPRSFDAMCTALTYCSDVSPFMLISGEMGRAAAAAFNGWYKSPASVAFNDIWNCTDHAAEVLADLQKSKSGNIELLRLCIDGYAERIGNEQHDKPRRKLTDDELTRLSWFLCQLHEVEWQTTFVSESNRILGDHPVDITKANISEIKRRAPQVAEWSHKLSKQINKIRKKEEKADKEENK